VKAKLSHADEVCVFVVVVRRQRAHIEAVVQMDAELQNLMPGSWWWFSKKGRSHVSGPNSTRSRQLSLYEVVLQCVMWLGFGVTNLHVTDE
jgi:hypothetical protein